MVLWSSGFGDFSRKKSHLPQGRKSPDFKQPSRSDTKPEMYRTAADKRKKGSDPFIVDPFIAADP